jgi:short-subunit dehydrogenase
MTRRLCLVTGASAGIGAAFARIYASHGYDLALTARRADRLEEVADGLRLRHGVETLVIPADLSDAAAVDQIVGAIDAQGRTVDALVNNAGYALTGGFLSSDWIKHRDFFRVMVEAPMELVHRLAPGMVERRFGRIVNVASVAGMIPGGAGDTLYSAAKSFLIKASQSLHLELEAADVHVVALCPGLTYSEFHDVAGLTESLAQTPAWAWMGPDEVAAIGYEAAEANRAIAVTGAPNKALAALAKALPDDWALALRARTAQRLRAR